MTKKIFRSILLVAVAVLLASLVIIFGFLYDYFGSVQVQHLKDEFSLAAGAVETSGVDYLSQLDSRAYRITWVAADGTVLYDTQAPAETMENHGDREEIRKALSDKEGDSIRYSATVTERTIYYARQLNDGTVLRISASYASAVTLALGMLQPVLVVAVLAILLSFLLASRMARRIVQPLNELDLDRPLDNDAYEELSPLLNRINQQHKQIDAQLRDLRQKTDEFQQVTSCMNEGLVLLDEQGAVLSINAAAQRLFGADIRCIGQDFLTVDRSHDLRLAIQRAMELGHGESRGSRSGREYQFDVSRIESDGDVKGAVILAFDVTEQALAEQRRREFTANVSHELKTPLQSIIGSAELLESGLVKEEDIPLFHQRIHKEAARLVTLVEDIIRLSQLDEGTDLPREEVELLALARDTAEQLQNAAAAKGVELRVTGTNVPVSGVRRLLQEILFNLCDNAVKYNKAGGSVEVSVSRSSAGAVLTVRDTGIGIPPEDHDRIFERFYRVDKSHSRASGGTGLGLSIVKHAAQYHNAHIDLESKPGEGTAITVTFPQSI